jgi:DNA topoisomerase-1
VKHGKVNATIPKDIEPEQTTLEQAVELIAARSAKGPTKKSTKSGSGSKASGKKSARKTGKSDKEAVEETAG